MWTRLMIFLGIKDHPREMRGIFRKECTFDEWYEGWQEFMASHKRHVDFMDRVTGRKK